MNLPNKLSLLRICLVPLFVLFFYLPDVIPGAYYIALAIFIVAALTDFLDGYIARKYNMVTDLGKLLDPIADKVLVCAALILLAVSNPLANLGTHIFSAEFFDDFGLKLGSILLPIGAIIILSRELLVSAVRMIAASKGIVVQANVYGKIKTIFQDISLPLLILLAALNCQPPLVSYVAPPTLFSDIVWLAAVLSYFAAVVMTVVSGVIYLVQNRKVLS